MARKKSGGGKKSYYKKKFFFSIRERILLHLSQYGMYENEVEAPDELSQFGIADVVRAGRSTCSKLLQEMEEEGLLYGRRAHVPSGKIRRTVYFLTPRGQMEAQKVRAKVERTRVKIKRPSGDTERIRVVDIPPEVPVYANLVDVACHISRGVFDVEKFVKRMQRRRQQVAYLRSMPRHRQFFDRNRERQAIRAWWEDDQARVLVLHGLPGVGKTTLASKVVTDLKEDTSVFWYRFYEWSNLRHVLREVGEFLARLNKKDLLMYVDTHETLDMAEVFYLLEKNLRDQEGLLVFDDYDKAEDHLESFFAALKDLVERVDGPKLLVAARSVPKFYDRRDVKVRETVQELGLEGLDREGAATLLTLKNIPEEEVDAIYRKTQGHPLFLELLHGSEVADTEDVDAFLREEVLDRLTDVQRRVLGLASVFRKPIPADALFLDDDVDFVVLTSLTDQSLLKETIPRIYDLHDLVRGFFYRQLTPDQRARYHQWAARFYAVQGQPEDLVEAQYHYLRAGEPESAADLAVERGRDIIGKGLLDQFARVLDELEKVDSDPETASRLRLLRGEIHDVKGNWEEAEAAYREVAEEAAQAGNPRPEAEACRALGALLTNRGEYDEAERELGRSLKLLGKLKDPEGQAEAYYWMGFLRNWNGEFMEAYRNFRKGYRLVQEDETSPIRADLLYAFGVNYSQRGNYPKAVSYKTRALNVFEERRDLRQLAKVSTGLGASYQELGDEEEALNHYRRGIEFARLIGDQRVLAYGLQNLASVHLQQERLDEAENMIRESSKMFQTVGEKRKVVWSHLYEGDLRFRRGETDKAEELWQDGLAELQKLNDVRGLSLFHLLIARHRLESGDYRLARDHLVEAERAAKDIGHEAVLQQIADEWDRLESLSQGKKVAREKTTTGSVPG